MLYRWDGTESHYIDTIYATWFTDIQNTYWKGNYSALASYDGKLLYSKPDCIMSYNPANGIFAVFYNYTGQGDIYGFQIADGQLSLQISNSPNEAGEIINVKAPY